MLLLRPTLHITTGLMKQQVGPKTAWERSTQSKEESLLLQLEMDILTNSERKMLKADLHTHVWDCIQCPHANHVLQKFIKILPPSEVQFVIDEIVQPTNGPLWAAEHKYGCRIILRLLE